MLHINAVALFRAEYQHVSHIKTEDIISMLSTGTLTHLAMRHQIAWKLELN